MIDSRKQRNLKNNVDKMSNRKPTKEVSEKQKITRKKLYKKVSTKRKTKPTIKKN